jgi:hypothetical protein
VGAIGYQYLCNSLDLTAFGPVRPARLAPVTRILRQDGNLSVPQKSAPQSAEPLDHLLFALKHEGMELQILAEALPKVEPSALLAELRRTPNGSYIRAACYLWEHFTGQQLSDLPAVGGAIHRLFDPQDYVTGPDQYVSRWRLRFNGLGSLDYCATVRRTERLQEALQGDVLADVDAFVHSLDRSMLERALSWAYLSETESSYAIEREAPGEDRQRRFVRLLQRAHERAPLSEDYLLELQNEIVANPYARAAQFRQQQNRLRNALRGAGGVTYLPPPPEWVPELMGALMAFSNRSAEDIDPIVFASVVSFGFVFIHPFMDGNGRLSRFLFHHALCRSGRLAEGGLLPVSVAMKHNEAEYLSALQSFSRPARERWSVRMVDDTEFETRFNGHPAMYRYWDATACVEYGFSMARQALDIHLKQEVATIGRYDKVYAAVNARFDLSGDDLATLIISALQNQGVVSKNRRKQFALQVPSEAFGVIEQHARAALLAERPPSTGS